MSTHQHPLAFVNLDTWLISDTHWEHPNIRKYCDRPEDHFELMHRNWVATVGEDEDILHLGDLVCFGNRNAHPTWLRGLTGNKYLLRGNHDEHDDEWYEAAGFKMVAPEEKWWTLGGRKRKLVHLPGPSNWIISFSHEPDQDDGAWDFNIHGHIHNHKLYEGTPRPGDRINVSVEVINYTPIRLRDLIGSYLYEGEDI